MILVMPDTQNNPKPCKHKNAHKNYEQCSVGMIRIRGANEMAAHCFVCADCGARIKNGEVVGYIEEDRR